MLGHEVDYGPRTEVVYTEVDNPYPETVSDAPKKQIKLNPVVIRNFKNVVKVPKKVQSRSHSDNGCLKNGNRSTSGGNTSRSASKKRAIITNQPQTVSLP